MLNSSSAFLLVTKYTPCVSQTKKKTAELVWAHLFMVAGAIFLRKKIDRGAWTVFAVPLVLETTRTHLSCRNPKPETRDTKPETLNHDP
jgi:hypothetical protein